MARDDNLGFDYNERTEVPTFGEISSVMNKKDRSSRARKSAKRTTRSKDNSSKKSASKSSGIVPQKGMPSTPSHKSHRKWFTFLLVAILVAGLGTAGYVYQDHVVTSVSKITGYFAVMTDQEKKSPQFPFVITEVTIDLQQEEDALVNTMNSNCEADKGKAVADVRTQKDAECDNKINPIQAALDKAESDYETYKDKYDECKEDLDVCEGA